MKLLITLIIAATMLLAGCSKDETDTRDSCEKNNTGSIKFKNTRSDGFRIYIDGTQKFTLYYNETSPAFEVSVGTHAVKAIQNEGYIFTPAQFDAFVTVTMCDTEFWSF